MGQDWPITTDGAVTEFLIPETAPAPARTIVTTNIAAGPDGALWFGFVTPVPDKGVRVSAGIGRITTDGAISKYLLPTSNSMPTFAIAAGPDGALWFFEQLVNKIGRLTITGAINEFPLPLPSRPLPGITAGPVWFSRGGNKIGRITTDGAVTEFLLPSASIALTAGPDDGVWFTALRGNKIGRIATDGVTKELLLPTSNSRSGQITAGPDGALWFAEANKIGRMTITGEFREFLLPTPDSRPNDITAGPDGAVWFTENFPDKNSKIGRIGQIDEDVKADLRTFHWERWVLYSEILASLAIIIPARLKRLHLH